MKTSWERAWIIGCNTVLIILLAIGGYWFYCDKKHDKASAMKEKSKQEKTNHIVNGMAQKYGADTNWENKICKEYSAGRRLMTYEFENAMLRGKPILIYANIEDIARAGKLGYIIKAKPDILHNVCGASWQIKYSLHCDNLVLDKVIGKKESRSHTEFAIVAGIESIDSEVIEGLEKKIAKGYCLDLKRIDR